MNPIWGMVLGFILHVYIIESSMFYGVSVCSALMFGISIYMKTIIVILQP